MGTKGEEMSVLAYSRVIRWNDGTLYIYDGGWYILAGIGAVILLAALIGRVRDEL